MYEDKRLNWAESFIAMSVEQPLSMFTDLRYHPDLTAAVLYRKFECTSLACNQFSCKLSMPKPIEFIVTGGTSLIFKSPNQADGYVDNMKVYTKLTKIIYITTPSTK